MAHRHRATMIILGITNGPKGVRDMSNFIAQMQILKRKVSMLEAKSEKLKEALSHHKHTDKCFNYAAKTARDSGNFYCIAECADSHKKAIKD